jgi:hypothetical protein
MVLVVSLSEVNSSATFSRHSFCHLRIVLDWKFKSSAEEAGGNCRTGARGGAIVFAVEWMTTAARMSCSKREAIDLQCIESG